MLVRDKALTQVLSEIDESTEIAVSVLCNREGFAIAYSINSEKAPDIDLLTPLAAVIHATANKAIEELHAGYHQTSIIESSKGTVLIRDIIDEIMLCCYIPKSAQERQVRIRTYMLGVALSTVERVATKIRKYLVSLKSPYDEQSLY